MAKLLKERLLLKCNIVLPESAFVLGNIRPDYSIKYKKTPHYKKDMYPAVEAMIADIATSARYKLNAYVLAYCLGIICHYLCDFFCYAHNEHFFGSKPDHFKYESLLYNLLKSKRKVIGQCDFSVEHNLKVDRVFYNLNSIYRDYIECEQQPCVDLAYSMTACLNVLIPLVEIVLGKEQITHRRLILNEA